MRDVFSRRTIFTLPNAISCFRLLIMPVYIQLFLLETVPQAHTAACVLLTVSCISDMLDGFIARKTNSVTLIGKILDPLADKFTQFSLLILIAAKYGRMIPVIILFLIKESFQLFAGTYYLWNGRMLTGALSIGKISTTVLFLTCLLILCLRQIDPHVMRWIECINIAVLSMSFISYIRTYFFKKSCFEEIHLQQ